MNNKLLYACYASSDYYARETGISMIGFLENNPDYDPEELFILDYGILKPNKEKLNNIAAKYGKYITYLPAKQILGDIQKKLNLSDFRGSLATYSRAFIDKIMPSYVEHLLYIDSDTVVAGSVSELKSFEMEGACMAGIISAFTHDIQNNKFSLYSGNKCYYGCGIVLFNIKNWRGKRCFEKIAKMLSIKKKYPCADQTLINNALSEDCFKELPLKYNYTTHIFSKAVENAKLKKGGYYSKEMILEALKSPAIIHYPGSPVNRPWYEGCKSRRKDVYYYYKKMSPWHNDNLIPLSEYKKTINDIHQLFGFIYNWLEIHSPSYTIVNIIFRCKTTIGFLLRYYGNFPQLPSEGIE